VTLRLELEREDISSDPRDAGEGDREDLEMER